MTEVLAALLIMTALWVAIRWRGQWLGVVLAGVTVGLATLVRPASLLVAPLLLVIWPAGTKAVWLKTAAATAVATFVVLPWTLRNCKVMDGCAFVSTNGGWNLAIGALTETGRFKTLHAADGCAVVTGQVQQDRCWSKIGRDTIASDPVRWLALIPKKLGQTYDHESFAIEYLREADPDAWPEERRVAARGLLSLAHRLLLLAAALSAVALVRWRRKDPWPWAVQTFALVGMCALGIYGFVNDYHPFFWLAALTPVVAMLHLPGRPLMGPVGRGLMGLLALTSATHAVFFGDDRYHLVVTPALCILAAGALRDAFHRRTSSLPPDTEPDYQALERPSEPA
jgi:hypothetical protein